MLEDAIVESDVGYLLPTPTCNDAKNNANDASLRRKSVPLSTCAVMDIQKLYPTPRTTGMCGGEGSKQMIQAKANLSYEEKKSMISGSGGKLNPEWVEWLMMFPIGWSGLDRMKSYEILDRMKDPAESGEIPRITDKNENRRDRLMVLGNAQVPLCAAVAFELLRTISEEE